MAIWQFRLTLIPEEELLKKFETLPLSISQELAEEFPWWLAAQPRANFEHLINRVLPERTSWSTSMRMWGQEDGDDAHVCYVDESKSRVEEISFRLDARAISLEVIRGVCALAVKLGCVLMTADYELMAADESIVLAAFNQSTAKKYIDDPISTLRSLSDPKVQERFKYAAKPTKKPN